MNGETYKVRKEMPMESGERNCITQQSFTIKNGRRGYGEWDGMGWDIV